MLNVSEDLSVATGGAIELRADLLDGRVPDNHGLVLSDFRFTPRTAPTRLYMHTDGSGYVQTFRFQLLMLNHLHANQADQC